MPAQITFSNTQIEQSFYGALFFASLHLLRILSRNWRRYFRSASDGDEFVDSRKMFMKQNQVVSRLWHSQAYYDSFDGMYRMGVPLAKCLTLIRPCSDRPLWSIVGGTKTRGLATRTNGFARKTRSFETHAATARGCYPRSRKVAGTSVWRLRSSSICLVRVCMTGSNTWSIVTISFFYRHYFRTVFLTFRFLLYLSPVCDCGFKE